jgi:hypothetical protein
MSIKFNEEEIFGLFILYKDKFIILQKKFSFFLIENELKKKKEKCLSKISKYLNGENSLETALEYYTHFNFEKFTILKNFNDNEHKILFILKDKSNEYVFELFGFINDSSSKNSTIYSILKDFFISLK